LYTDYELTEVDRRGLERAVAVAAEAKATGNLAFGAVLFDADGDEVGSAFNTVRTTGDPTEHAETQLVRQVVLKLSREELVSTTMYASCEPCPMCAGAIFNAGIRRVFFALPSARFRALIDNQGGARMPSLLLTTKQVLDAGEEPSIVHGGFQVPGSETLFNE
jgi:tRNA(Arg) A34 adenosine deaminase TadA